REHFDEEFHRQNPGASESQADAAFEELSRRANEAGIAEVGAQPPGEVVAESAEAGREGARRGPTTIDEHGDLRDADGDVLFYTGRGAATGAAGGAGAGRGERVGPFEI